MSIHVPAAAFAEAKPVAALVRRNRVPRTFDLHPAIFYGLLGTFVTFQVIMGIAFMTRELVVVFGICFAYLAMYFAVPAWWARVVPHKEGPRQSWAEFMREGIETGSGHLTGSAALAQIFTVPVLLVGWAVAVAVISALVLS
jgi:hypothetical protein